MRRLLTITAVCIGFAGCTVIKINHGDTETIEYDGDVEVAKDLTTRACRKVGQQSAEIISTVNKDPALPPGKGRQVTTFRCRSDALSPPGA